MSDGYDEDETARAAATLSSTPTEEVQKFYDRLALFNDPRYQRLIKFYSVTDPQDLIEEMEKHIQRLDDEVRRWRPTKLWGTEGERHGKPSKPRG